jgi:hypothetical protein
VQRQRQVHAVAAAQRLHAVLHAQVDQRHRHALLVAGHLEEEEEDHKDT